MSNIIHIAQGFINDAIKTEHWEVIAKARLSICNKCEEYDPEGTKCKVPGTQPCCAACGCSLNKKARSNSTCPLKKW